VIARQRQALAAAKKHLGKPRALPE
jgi:hypothetical protein